MCHHREDKVKVVFDRECSFNEKEWDVRWVEDDRRLKSFHDAEEAMEYASHINALETDVER